jgi:hypothetical protein
MTVTGAPSPGEKTPTGRSGMPARSRYWWPALLALLGLVLALAAATAAQAAMSSRADGFLRAGVPGELAVSAERGRTYYVYAEGTLWRHPSVRVMDPAGRTVAVTPSSEGPLYDHGGNGGGAIATFHAGQAGVYRVAVATGDTAQGDFAVGGRFPLWMRLSDWGVWGLLVLGAGSGVVLAVVTAVRRRRFVRRA